MNTLSSSLKERWGLWVIKESLGSPTKSDIGALGGFLYRCHLVSLRLCPVSVWTHGLPHSAWPGPTGAAHSASWHLPQWDWLLCHCHTIHLALAVHMMASTLDSCHLLVPVCPLTGWLFLTQGLPTKGLWTGSIPLVTEGSLGKVNYAFFLCRLWIDPLPGSTHWVGQEELCPWYALILSRKLHLLAET